MSKTPRKTHHTTLNIIKTPHKHITLYKIWKYIKHTQSKLNNGRITYTLRTHLKEHHKNMQKKQHSTYPGIKT